MTMINRPRILITGFGPFPGARFNPTQALVAHLSRVRRPYLDGFVRIPHIFTVSYAAVDAELPQLIADHQPDAILMFGLAARTRHIRIEMRARNAISMLWPDATSQHGRRMFIERAKSAQTFGPHTLRLLKAAARTGLDVRPSRDAGRYLCNYLAWRAIESSRNAASSPITAFIHVPNVARDHYANGMTNAELARAGEEILREVTRMVRSHRISAR